MKLSRVISGVAVASFATPLAIGVLIMVDRVDAPARFVTWPVVAFTAVAALVAVLGLQTGLSRPPMLAIGALASLMVSYILPAAPFPLVAVVVVCVGGLAVTTDGMFSGLAMGTGSLMVLLAILQAPAVECGESSITSGAGPWWIESPTNSSGSASMSADGIASGTTQVGDRRYAYTCDQGQLTSFGPAG